MYGQPSKIEAETGRSTNSVDRKACRPLIRAKYDKMTPAYRKIADFILLHPDHAIHSSITDLADRAGVGEATVSRFCRMLGFSAFQDLKVALAQEIAPAFNAVSIHPDGGSDGLTRQVAERIRSITESTTQFLNEELVEEAVEILSNARKIDFYGVGASGITALAAEHRFMRIGKLCTAYPDPHVQAMSAALLTPQDVAVAFSHSGSTKDIVGALQLARESGAKTICVTGSARSPITRVSDIVLLASVGETTVVTSLYSKIGQLFVVERLFTGCMLRFSKEAQAALDKTTRGIINKMY